MTWDETDDPYDVVVGGSCWARPVTAAPRIAVSDTLWASHLLRLQAAASGRPVRARVAGPARTCG